MEKALAYQAYKTTFSRNNFRYNALSDETSFFYETFAVKTYVYVYGKHYII